MNPKESFSSVVHSLAARRVKRAAHRQLERELADYTTPNDRLELDLLIGQYPESETRELQDILNRQAVRAA